MLTLFQHRRVQSRVEEENAVRIITAQDYTVHVQNLPREEIDPDEVYVR